MFIHWINHRLIFLLIVTIALTLTFARTSRSEKTPISPLATQGPKLDPTVPPDAEEIRASIQRGVDFLLESQLKNGAWGSARKTKDLNIYAPVPGSHHAFRTAVTSLGIIALIDVKDILQGPRLQSAEEALDRAQAWLLKHAGNLRRAEAEAIYNVWGHSFAIQAISLLHTRAEGDSELQSNLINLCEYQADRLRRYQSINGGWGYYDLEAHTRRPSSSSISFTTATALIALKDAKKLGVDFPENRIQQAIDSIMRQRFPDYAYAYGEYLKLYPRYDINRPAGSLGRSQVCNLALRHYGDVHITDKILKTWLNRLIARNGWLSIGRKYPVPHESHFAIAGYFYYYGHYYAAFCIEELPEAEQRYFQDHLAKILLPLQEKDGSWWDYPLYNYHQQYGTSMALSSLIRCYHTDNHGKQEE